MSTIKPVLFLLIMGLAVKINAQQIELSPLANYHFGGKINVREGSLKLASSDSYGAALTVKGANPDFGLEAFWIRQDSRLSLKNRSGIREELFNMVTEYINVGAVREVDLGDLRPFFIAGVGAVIFTPQDEQFSSETRMSASFTGGFKYFINEKVGIRIQTQLLMPIQWGGAGIFCGSGGCGGTVGGTTTVVQGTVGGGIILALGRDDI